MSDKNSNNTSEGKEVKSPVESSKTLEKQEKDTPKSEPKVEKSIPTSEKIKDPIKGWVPKLVLKKMWDNPGGKVTSNLVLTTVGGVDLERVGKSVFTIEQLKRLAPVIARKHCLWYMFDYSESDFKKLRLLSVNEVSRLYQSEWRSSYPMS